MMPQFATPIVAQEWALSRNTHEAVAMAIHAIADDRRPPEAIWEDPTRAEWQNITMAVENYINSGLFPVEEDGCYAWGDVFIDWPRADVEDADSGGM